MNMYVLVAPYEGWKQAPSLIFKYGDVTIVLTLGFCVQHMLLLMISIKVEIKGYDEV